MLWIGGDHELAGGLAFAIGRLPRHALLALGGPDADKDPQLYAGLTAGFVFLIAVAFTSLGAAGSRGGEGQPRLPKAAVILAGLILVEVLYLLFAEMPRIRFGERRTSFFVPWHIAALGVTGVFIYVSQRIGLTLWSYRSYWLAMFAMALFVLFPMIDSL